MNVARPLEVVNPRKAAASMQPAARSSQEATLVPLSPPGTAAAIALSIGPVSIAAPLATAGPVRALALAGGRTPPAPPCCHRARRQGSGFGAIGGLRWADGRPRGRRSTGRGAPRDLDGGAPRPPDLGRGGQG